MLINLQENARIVLRIVLVVEALVVLYASLHSTSTTLCVFRSVQQEPI